MSEVWQLYDEVAAAFAQDRTRLIGEEAYLDEIVRRSVAERPQILDLGCGTGVPIARYLIEHGCEVTGVDAAPAMIDLAGARFPTMTWLVHDMRELALCRRFRRFGSMLVHIPGLSTNQARSSLAVAIYRALRTLPCWSRRSR